MENRHPEYEAEVRHLGEVCGKLSAEIADKDNEIGNHKSEIVSIRKNMWENSKHAFGGNETEAMIEATQYISAIKNEENSYRFIKALMEKYKRLLYSPYFARIDLREADEQDDEKIYIGLYSFIDMDSMQVLIHDWRAPVASVFYEYEQGPAEYDTGVGRIKVGVTLKRQFKIKDSKLLYMFDSSVKIDDELLQEILSGNASDRMKNIVTTIQREQNRVIRFEGGSFLGVQGAAGSGKTSIALHRIAYLLYKDRNLDSNNIVIFSPNHVFNDYISDVLPELGEERVLQTTFDEYATKLIKNGFRFESFNDHMEYLLSCGHSSSEDIRLKGYSLKNSEELRKALGLYCQEIADRAEGLRDIYFGGRVIIKGSELRRVYLGTDSGLPLNKRLAAVKTRALYLLSKTEEARKAELLRIARENSDNSREAAAKARMELNREFREVREHIHEITRLRLPEVFEGFLDSRYFYEAGRAFGLEEYEVRTIGRHTAGSICSRQAKYEDTAILAYLRCFLDELPDTACIKHVVIDEAQDYSPLQYEVFKKLFPKSSFTILGDVNQLINPYRKAADFERMKDIFGREDSAILRLSKSYRSTREITQFSRAILPSDLQIESLNRAGKLPAVIRLETGCDSKRVLQEDIEALQAAGMKSIALLCRTAGECRELYRMLGNDSGIGMVLKDDDLYKSGVNIMPSYFCKGLEFDAVILYGADRDNYHTEGDRGLIYTLCTRALHILRIYYSDRLSPILESIDEALYEKK
ncbi:MAG TPA: UvrD-helicase domain-containing protein [Negativicutes bacterium]|nr:UvrD-helicase domain-containing protein [Negativicutes bacterium]